MSIYGAKISEKGQLTVPLEVRKKLGIQSAGKVTFKIAGDGAVVVAAKKLGLAHLKGLFGKPENPINIDAEIMKSVAEDDHPSRRVKIK